MDNMSISGCGCISINTMSFGWILLVGYRLPTSGLGEAIDMIHVFNSEMSSLYDIKVSAMIISLFLDFLKL